MKFNPKTQIALLALILAACSDSISVPATPIANIGLAQPESVAYDATQDVLFVSNMAGETDGFIAKLSPDGTVIDLKFISPSKQRTTLRDPKGLAIHEGTLIVSDVDTARFYDAKTGDPKGELKIDSAAFLNDVAVMDDGTILVTDSEVNPASNWAKTGTGSVYAFNLSDPAASLQRLVVDDNPNGVLALGNGEFMLLSLGGTLVDVRTIAGSVRKFNLPKGTLDGAVIHNGRIYITSWDAKGIYGVDAQGSATEFTLGTPNAADPGLDTKRNVLIVPLTQADKLVFFPLS